MMDGQEKSDSGIVAAKPTNKAGQPAAEPVEPRPETQGERETATHAPGTEPGSNVPVADRYGRPQG